MRTLYFDCFSGAAGDMILGALIDAGLPLQELKQALGGLGVEGWDISAEKVVKTGITATKFRVHEHASAFAPAGATADKPVASASARGDTSGELRRDLAEAAFGREGGPRRTQSHPHYHLSGIKKRIDQSALSEGGKARAKRLFDRLAGAEAAIHNMPVEKVHLHEVGALDSIVDIVGCVFALEWFDATRIVVSPLNVGSGTVSTAHGIYPVPAPATLQLLGDAPVYSANVAAELLTPTGALVLTDYASAFGPMPPMTVQGVGYGAGDRDFEHTPNVLRVIIGRESAQGEAHKVSVIECEIDDMNPQIFGHLMDQLYAAGALEVFYSAVQMKKNRPGTLLTVIARPADRDALVNLVFSETTTIGIRFSEMQRECLQREVVRVMTPLGAVRFKVAERDGRVFNAQPEFDDLARLATEHGRPVKEVQALAAKAWLER